MGGTATGRYRNFDAIRLAAATAVVFSHSFALSATGLAAEPLVSLLGEKRELGLFGVGAFFVISGFLITRSWERRASVTSYVANRALRIFPGLIACAVVTGVLIGPWFADSVGGYFESGGFRGFMVHTVTLQDGGGTGLPVPWYDGDYGWWAIGTFWTLPAEFTAYIGVMLLGMLRLLRLPVALAFVAFGLWSHSHWPIAFLGGTAWTVMFFAAGSALYFVHRRRRPPRGVALAAVAGLVVSAALGYGLEGMAVFGSIALIQLATSDSVTLPQAARHGDLSYGLYLYGWPAQQLVRAALGPSVTWLQMFALAMPLGLAASWLSWHLVEARALALARRIGSGARVRKAADDAAAAAPGDVAPSGEAAAVRA